MPKTPHIRRLCTSDLAKLCDVRPVEVGVVTRPQRDDHAGAVDYCNLARLDRTPIGCLLQREIDAAVRDVVGEREAVRVLPDEAHEACTFASKERDEVTRAPSRRDPSQVANEADAADDRRRR